MGRHTQRDLDCDLVIAALPGVQRFIAESRRTADLFASSELMSKLAAALRGAVEEPAELVMPASSEIEAGIPNRVVALAPAGQGEELARSMARAVQRCWTALLDGAPPSPGFPVVQWVVVPPGDGYEAQWKRAQWLLAQRKRIRDFAFPPQPQTHVCSLTGRWPAIESRADPPARWRASFDRRLGEAPPGTAHRLPVHLVDRIRALPGGTA